MSKKARRRRLSYAREGVAPATGTGTTAKIRTGAARGILLPPDQQRAVEERERRQFLMLDGIARAVAFRVMSIDWTCTTALRVDLEWTAWKWKHQERADDCLAHDRWLHEQGRRSA